MQAAPSGVLGAAHLTPVTSSNVSSVMQVQGSGADDLPQSRKQAEDLAGSPCSRQRDLSAKPEGPGVESDPTGQLDVVVWRPVGVAAQPAEASTMDLLDMGWASSCSGVGLCRSRPVTRWVMSWEHVCVLSWYELRRRNICRVCCTGTGSAGGNCLGITLESNSHTR